MVENTKALHYMRWLFWQKENRKCGRSGLLLESCTICKDERGPFLRLVHKYQQGNSRRNKRYRAGKKTQIEDHNIKVIRGKSWRQEVYVDIKHYEKFGVLI